MADRSDRNCLVPARQGMTRKPYKSSQQDISLTRSQGDKVPGLLAIRKLAHGRIVGYSYKWNCLFNPRSVSR